ncbi:hypothetical protein PPERSA_11479 [Pseudocohnilembus persalinus]|uniref:Uncharacterized protein n=1 Tax=Pseudocohnilembus persalinus TaxID=266149 RepID=A0A0V0QX65_PSEPJ|nr:hypothetical protein PPERSA_11479 [Pseudocohnilembus persalinus]|eukprot:KRX06834.1 hypothetical protein PPERSA_11479 [Pseudocohnilembus persalinus]
MKNQVFEKYDEEEKKQSFENQIKCKSCNKFTPFEDKLYCANCICSLCGENIKIQNSPYCQKCLCYQCKLDTKYQNSNYCKKCLDKSQKKQYDVNNYSNSIIGRSKFQQQSQEQKLKQLINHNLNQIRCKNCQKYDKEFGKQYCTVCLCRTCKSNNRISNYVSYCKDCVCELCQKQIKKLNKSYCETCLCYNCKSNPKIKNEIYCLQCIQCKNCKKQKKRYVNDTFCQDCLCNNCSKEVKLQGYNVCQNCLKKYYCNQCKKYEKYKYKDFCVNCICNGCQKEKKENGQNICYNCIQKQQYCVQCKRNYKQKSKDICSDCESRNTSIIPTPSQNTHFQQVNNREYSNLNQNQKSIITGQIVTKNNDYQDPNKIYYYDSKLKNPQSLQVHNLQNNNLQKKEVHTFLNEKSLPQIEQPRLTNQVETPTQNIDTNEKNNQNAIKDKCTVCKRNKKKKNDQICQKCIEAYRKQRGVNEISIWNDKKCNICQKMDKKQNDDRGICRMCFRDFAF